MRRVVRAACSLTIGIATCSTCLFPGGSALAAGRSYTSSRLLLLKPSLLPPHYRYRGYNVQDSVIAWDGGIRQVMQIDERNGWMEAATERLRDPRGREAQISVQLFRTPSGAKQDFNQFFTNSHPETVYEPGSSWLGGSPISGLGKPATIYRVSNPSTGCAGGLQSGISYVYRNALVSIATCLRSVGEAGAKDLAHRVLKRAQVLARNRH